jgi:catechol 2,3-dioxygenase-like lactoylglutathione lyase family enzyme
MVNVRYIVNDVTTAITFYCQHLGFHEELHPAPAFAILRRGDLRLLLSGTGYRLKSPISPLWLRRCAPQGSIFATTLSPALAANRSCSTTPPAIPSNYSNHMNDGGC